MSIDEISVHAAGTAYAMAVGFIHESTQPRHVAIKAQRTAPTSEQELWQGTVALLAALEPMPAPSFPKRGRNSTLIQSLLGVGWSTGPGFSSMEHPSQLIVPVEVSQFMSFG